MIRFILCSAAFLTLATIPLAVLTYWLLLVQPWLS
jgi:hypothetical protein